MDDTMDDTNEMISALADGRLDGRAFAETVEAVCADREAMATWHAYHVIGEVLRSTETGAGRSAPDFLGKLNARLAQERPSQPAAGTLSSQRRRPAANDEAFRWKMVAGIASFAAVGAIGWSMVGVTGGSSQQPRALLASVPQQAPASAPATVLARAQGGAVMIRDPRLDEFLAAHRQLGGVSALQMPAGFVRAATVEAPGR